MRVLVVEDESKVARFLKQALEEEGHVVDVAGDGVEGGNLAHINPYDLILLDVQLPRMDGLQLAAELRRSGLQCPILMLTSRDSTQDVVRGLNAGADDYLTKPFALEELLARVSAITRRQLGPATGILRYQDLEMDRLRRSHDAPCGPTSATTAMWCPSSPSGSWPGARGSSPAPWRPGSAAGMERLSGRGA